jgi:hypothetical protein
MHCGGYRCAWAVLRNSDKGGHVKQKMIVSYDDSGQEKDK